MNSLKKRLLLGALIAVIGVFAFLALRVTPGVAPPAAAIKEPPRPVVETPEHELKALAVELQKKPGHVPVLIRMAQLERDKGKIDDAVSHLRDAVNSEPANVDARLELGRALFDKGDVGGAIAETEKIVASDPRQVDALYNLGAIYANLGNAERARSYWKKAVESGANADSGKKAQQGLSKLGGA